MKFSEIPNLSKFERFAAEHSDDEIVQHAYHMVEARLLQVVEPDEGTSVLHLNPHGPEQLLIMKDRCAAVEESTRIIWACAAATGNINPPMWDDGNPDFQEAVNYFWELPDLEWMELTHHYRILWEKRVGFNAS
jgi:hypothetical protein